MEVIVEQNRCTGCGACSTICPTGSISMRADEKGFLYPHINETICCQCERCKSVCPALHCKKVWPEEKKMPEVYAAWTNDKTLRYESTSGGIFSELAYAILKKGGCVVGAKYNKEFLVKHTLIESRQELRLLRQSKYVQSDSGSIYWEVKANLEKGRQVLFTGTPCQCAALKSYLKKDYEGLILCDLICRGVNSPKAYQAYLRDLEQHYGGKIIRVWFKNKRDGWTRFSTKIDFDNGKSYCENRYDDDFMYGFIRKNLNLYLRPSCTQCAFKGISRPTDITLGDFWNVEVQDSKGDFGISAVLVHSEKGRNVFQTLSNITCEKKTTQEVIDSNECLEGCVQISKEADYFWQKIQEGISFHEIMKYIKNVNLQEEKRRTV